MQGSSEPAGDWTKRRLSLNALDHQSGAAQGGVLATSPPINRVNAEHIEPAAADFFGLLCYYFARTICHYVFESVKSPYENRR
jgi:hypothetical protein